MKKNNKQNKNKQKKNTKKKAKKYLVISEEKTVGKKCVEGK